MNTRPPRQRLEDVLGALGRLLESRGNHVELVIVGGATLLLRGVISRPTRDVDVLGARASDGAVVRLTEIPAALGKAVADVGLAYGLAPDWLNLGPASVLDLGLPPGFEGRLERHRFGGLVLWYAGRFDLLCFKLHVASDRWPSIDRHLDDLRALRPTGDELRDAAGWTRAHDPSPAFAANQWAVLASLGPGGDDGPDR